MSPFSHLRQAFRRPPTTPAGPVEVSATPFLRRVGAALHQREFRFFLAGAFLSNVGSWMQSIAQAWLVLQLTNSAFYLGLDGFATTIPISVFAFTGGVIADHVNRRRLLIVTQWILLGLAAALGLLVQLNVVRVWQIIAFSFFTGLTQAISWPVYQAILADVVERKDLPNAIALNSAQFNLARTIGPVAGAAGLALFGTAGCFYANAVSFLAVIWALQKLIVRETHSTEPLSASGFFRSFKDGLRYLQSVRPIAILLLTMAMTSILGVPLITLLPVYARDILSIGAPGLGLLGGMFGAGAVAGGMVVAYRGNFPRKGASVLHAVFIFCISMVVFSASRWLPLSLICLFVAGYTMVAFASVVNSLVQTSTPDHMRGRAMGLFVFSFGGCMPIGNLLAGTLAHRFGAPRTLIAQGIVLGLYALFIYWRYPETKNLS